MSTFSPWQQRAFDQTVAALDAGRLGHGLLICGPAGLGKRDVALALADHVAPHHAEDGFADLVSHLLDGALPLPAVASHA